MERQPSSGKMYKRAKVILISSIWMMTFYGCVEEFVPQTQNFESALVIEATITNELKPQEIRLSRTFRFESDVPNPEGGAVIKILDDASNEYGFEETDTGTYLSVMSFSAQPNRQYTLDITTSDGRKYASDPTQLTQTSTIDQIYAERLMNDDGVEGISIFVDSFDPTSSSRFYRYEYEETFKIIAPEWNSVALAPAPEGGEGEPGEGEEPEEDEEPAEGGGDFGECDVVLVQGFPEEEVCFASATSNSIIIASTESLDSDRVLRFPVRFIDRDNYIISHRYSILVKQFVQSSGAHTFFRTLQDFSGSESLFTDTQPGFFNGNVFSQENEDEKVLGYFDVASVTEKRLFFNYDDFFPGEDLPPYERDCEPIAPPLATDSGCFLRPLVESNAVRYVSENVNPTNVDEGPYLVVPRACGDCTALGSIEIPDFWVE